VKLVLFKGVKFSQAFCPLAEQLRNTLKVIPFMVIEPCFCGNRIFAPVLVCHSESTACFQFSLEKLISNFSLVGIPPSNFGPHFA
jgi:hypothetical protein